MKLKLSWEHGKFLLQQGKAKQVQASQGKSTSLQNRLLEVRVIVRVFGLQQVEKDVNKIQQQLRYCQHLSTKARTVKNVKKVFWTVLKVFEKSPTYLLPPDTALLTSHCHSCDGALRPTRRMCRTTTPTTNESRTY